MKNIALIILFFSTSVFCLARPEKFDGVYVGQYYACGHDQSSVFCWGSGGHNVHLNMDGFSHIRTMELQERYGCLVDDQGMFCWGSGSIDLLPEMQNSSSIKLIKGSYSSICALIEGKVYCGGLLKDSFNDLEQVSNFALYNSIGCAVHEGKITCRGSDDRFGLLKIPQGISDAKGVSVSFSSICYYNSSSEISCWGQSQNVRNFQVPFPIASLTTSSFTICAQGFKGEVFCDGSLIHLPLDYGALYQLSFDNSLYSFCALNQKREIFCSSKVLSYVPPVVRHPIKMSAGYEATFFVDPQGLLFSSGYNSNVKPVQTYHVRSLEARDGSVCYVDDHEANCIYNDPQLFIERPNDMTRFKTLIPGHKTYCGILNDETVECFGSRSKEEINVSFPLPDSGLDHVLKLTSGHDHFCTLDRLNEIVCWGKMKSPAFVSPQAKILDLASGGNFACALLADQNVECWGNLDPEMMMTPGNLEGAHGLIAGRSYACAYGAKTIFCWGKNSQGIIEAPRVIGTLKAVTGGYDHACLEDDEGVKCWGRNREGQYQFLRE